MFSERTSFALRSGQIISSYVEILEVGIGKNSTRCTYRRNVTEAIMGLVANNILTDRDAAILFQTGKLWYLVLEKLNRTERMVDELKN